MFSEELEQILSRDSGREVAHENSGAHPCSNLKKRPPNGRKVARTRTRKVRGAREPIAKGGKTGWLGRRTYRDYVSTFSDSPQRKSRMPANGSAIKSATPEPMKRLPYNDRWA